MGYLIFVPNLGWVKVYRKSRSKVYGGGYEVTYTQNRDEACIFWTYLGAKRAARKISGFSEIVEL